MDFLIGASSHLEIVKTYIRLVKYDSGGLIIFG